MLEVDLQFTLVNLGSWNRIGVMLKVVPGNRLCLVTKRCYICPSPISTFVLECPSQKEIDRQRRLPETAMANQYAEPLQRVDDLLLVLMRIKGDPYSAYHSAPSPNRIL